jgi:hypothetical protein
MDNPFDIPASGQADWDSGLQQDFYAIERGYHVTERAGQAVSSGQVLWLNSGGFFFPYNPNSAATQPHAYAFTAAASGDSLTALGWGIVRSLAINSPVVPGQPAFCNASGFLSAATLGLAVGYGLSGRGILFNPQKPSPPTASYTPTYFPTSLAINAVVGSLHTFTFSLGNRIGDNRRVRLNGSSAAHVELKLYGDAGMTGAGLQYSTISGGVSAVNSFNDRAGWPFDCDSGTIYGTLMILSGDVSSDTISVQGSWRY